MCDRYAELRKDFRKAIESCETQSETIKVMDRTIDMLHKGVIGTKETVTYLIKLKDAPFDLFITNKPSTNFSDYQVFNKYWRC